MLTITADKLAELSSVSIATIRRAEASHGIPSITPANLLALKRALEAQGIEFIDSEKKKGPGVRLKRDHAAMMKELLDQLYFDFKSDGLDGHNDTEAMKYAHRAAEKILDQARTKNPSDPWDEVDEIYSAKHWY